MLMTYAYAICQLIWIWFFFVSFCFFHNNVTAIRFIVCRSIYCYILRRSPLCGWSQSGPVRSPEQIGPFPHWNFPVFLFSRKEINNESMNSSVGQSVSRSVGQSVSKSISCWICYSVSQLVNQSINQLIDPSFLQPVGQTAGRPVGQSVVLLLQYSSN